MTSRDDPYSRVYWRFRDEFPDVYADKNVFGWWTSLLLTAEGSHPSAAELPRKISARVLGTLSDAGLVELLPGDRFRVRGLTKERERRTESARVGGLASSRSRTQRTVVEQSLNDRSTNGAPRRDETRRDEQRLDEQSIGAPATVTSSDGVFLLVQELTNRPFSFSPGSRPWQMLTEDVTALGEAKVSAAYRAVAHDAEGPLDAAGVIYGGHNRLYPIPSAPRRLTPAEEKKQEAADYRAAIERRRQETASA